MTHWLAAEKNQIASTMQSPAEVGSILYISDGRKEIIPQQFNPLLAGVTPLYAASAFTSLLASYILRNFIENRVSVENFFVEFMVLAIFKSKTMGKNMEEEPQGELCFKLHITSFAFYCSLSLTVQCLMELFPNIDALLYIQVIFIIGWFVGSDFHSSNTSGVARVYLYSPLGQHYTCYFTCD